MDAIELDTACNDTDVLAMMRRLGESGEVLRMSRKLA